MKRTQFFTKLPWNGGLNDTVDPGFLDNNDLVIADNIQMATSGVRAKRPAFDFFDTDLPAVIKRTSSGTTKTIQFADSIFSGTDELLVIGEKLLVTTSLDAGNELGYVVSGATLTTISTTTLTNDTITYTGSGSSTESNVTTATLTVKRSSAYICTYDYWRTNSSFVKVQLFMAVTDQGKLFRYNSSGQRFEVQAHPQEFTSVAAAASTLATGEYFDFDSLTTAYRVWVNIDAGGGAPSAGGRTLVEVALLSTDTATQVAGKFQVAIDVLSGVTATVDDTTLTVVLDSQGVAAIPVDGTIGATFTVTKLGRSITTPFSATITKANMVVQNDVLITAFTGVGNLPIRYRPETDDFYYTLGGSPPDFSTMQVHQSRLFANNKLNKDRLEYTSPDNPEEWNGDGDSAALDIFPGDGDPEGIIAIHPPFKGVLFVGKSRKLYRILGTNPEDYTPDLITSGLGSLAQRSVAIVDLDDQVFVSTRGFHSLEATQNFGDFDSKFLSSKIQNAFKHWSSGRIKFTQAAYVPDINSIAFSITEDGDSQQSSLYIINVKSQEWYRWPEIDCQSVNTRRVGDSDKLIIGTSNSRLMIQDEQSFTDFGTTPYIYRVKTGSIYPAGNASTEVAFKSISFYYKPKGTFTFTVTIKIDNFPAQSLSFSQATAGDLLGVNFVLGISRLGSENVLAPYTKQLEGVGRGCTIDIQSTGSDEQVEIYGFTIEYDPLGVEEEVLETT